MISIKTLEKIEQDNLVMLEDYELLAVNGGGLTPLDTGIGVVAGGIGGAIGQVGYNASKGQPLTKDVPQAIGVNAAFCALNPVSGVASFGIGVGKAAGGAFGVPTAIDAGKSLLPQGGFSPTGLGAIKF
jgi:hypothetical protein